MYDPNSAFAASGGRMGGRSFSSSSSSSRSYSVPRTSGLGFSYSAPYYAPSPFGGVYVGPALGVGVGTGLSFFFILVRFLAFVLVSGFLSDRSEGSVLTVADKTTVLKLQVGLLGMGRTLQKDLNRIAEVADTSTSEGLHYVLTETTLALLRHPDYCISAYSFDELKKHMVQAESSGDSQTTAYDYTNWKNDIYSKVKGPEKRGYVRCLGKLSPTKDSNTSSQSSIGEQRIQKLEKVLGNILSFLQARFSGNQEIHDIIQVVNQEMPNVGSDQNDSNGNVQTTTSGNRYAINDVDYANFECLWTYEHYCWETTCLIVIIVGHLLLVFVTYER